MKTPRNPIFLIAVLLIASTAVLPAYTVLAHSTKTCNHSAIQSSSSEDGVKVAVEGYDGAVTSGSTTLNLTAYFQLRNIDIPYKVVSLSPFANTLVTFQLPPNYHSKYFSVVWDGNGTTGYLVNSSDAYQAFSHSKYLGEYMSVSKATAGACSLTVVTIARMYTTPLPGGYNDTTVTAIQSVNFYDNLGQKIGIVTAEGTFNYILGGDVTNVSYNGSAAHAYNGYGISLNSPVAGGANTTIGYVQENIEGIFCLIFASDWWAAWPGMSLNSLTGSLTFTSHPWNVGWTTGCG